MLVSDYGMLFALLLLGAYYSWATLSEQHPTGAAGARRLAEQLKTDYPAGGRVLVVGRPGAEDAAFAEILRTGLPNPPWQVVDAVQGEPVDARAALDRWTRTGEPRIDFVACNQTTAAWAVFEEYRRKDGLGAKVRLVTPGTYRWPNFLKADNLLNVANQIAVIAIIAVGMTFVIIGGGIDLSVGSLIALAAVVTTWAIRDFAGAEHASALGMAAAAALGVGLCGGLGVLSGLAVTAMSIPAFIVTLAMMLVASGLAFIWAQGQSIYQVPPSFTWLGRGSTAQLPHAVWLMLILYAVAHLVMSRSVLGRYVYAVGGNAEAARLSGVPVRAVRVFTYGLSGGLAGLGGVVMASQLQSGSPTYGQMYELYVIAAVVVGGTSLSGGQGKVLGTLIGAFIIAVIQNGMNLTGVESYTQKVVLGLVILGAVLLDIAKRRGGHWWRAWWQRSRWMRRGVS